MERIRALLPELKGKNLILARYLLRTYGSGQYDPFQLSTNTLQAELGVSRPTVVRFARWLGYEGFSDFKAALVAHAASQRSGSHPRNDSVLGKVYHDTMQSFEATMRTLDPALVNECAHLVARSRSIVWYGTGDSGILAASANHKSLIVQLPSRVVTDPHDMAILVQQLSPPASVIAISQSGKWKSMIESIRLVKAQGIPTICITSHPESALARISDYVLVSAARDWWAGGRWFTLRAPQAMIVDALILTAATAVGAVDLRFEDPLLVEKA